MNAISGISASRMKPGILWVHNAGNIDRLFAIDTNGRPAGTFTLPQKLLDAEDIAIGPGPVKGVSYLYIADIGGEPTPRSSLTLVRVLDPPLDPDDSSTRPFASSEYFTLEYPNSSHHAEALLIDPDSGDVLLVTKEPDRAVVFAATQVQLAAASALLTPVGELPLGQVTAGDISPNGTFLAVRSEASALVWTRKPGESLIQALAGKPAPLPLAANEVKGKSLAFDSADSGYYTTGVGDSTSWCCGPYRSFAPHAPFCSGKFPRSDGNRGKHGFRGASYSFGGSTLR